MRLVFSVRKHAHVIYRFFPLIVVKIELFSRSLYFSFFFFFFAQNIDHGYAEAVLTSFHNLCVGAKIRKNRYMYITPYPSFAI